MEKISVKDIDKIDLKGKLICFPTDTVYGLACLIDDDIALKKIFEIKNRDLSKPIAVLCRDANIDKYVRDVSDKARDLMREYWPGALTIIFKKTDLINDIISSGRDTVGFRMPNSKVALAILDRFKFLATTSVNISGKEALNDIKEIEKHFSNKIDYLVCDEEEMIKCSSTVVDASGEDIVILRQGSVIL